MGGIKSLYTQQLTGDYEAENGIEYNGNVYKDHGDNNGYTNYTLIDCPICGKKILKVYEKDTTPGFKSSTTAIKDKMCDCDLKSYYKENDPYTYVCC